MSSLFSAFAQLAVVLAISAVAYAIARVFSPRQSFADFLGLTAPAFDRGFVLVWLGIALFGVLTTLLEFRFCPEIRSLLLSDSSPYGKILQSHSLTAVKGLLYCFIQAAAAEELLFRGLIAKRLFRWAGFRIGNVLQAFVFWLMHWLIFRLVTGEWFSLLQGITFVTAFGLGLVLGWVNWRRGGESIAPSWLLHGSGNFFCFVTLAYLGSVARA